MSAVHLKFAHERATEVQLIADVCEEMISVIRIA